MENNLINTSIPLVLTYKKINNSFKTTSRGTGIIIEQNGVSKDVKLFDIFDLLNDRNLFICQEPNISYNDVLIDLSQNVYHYVIGKMIISSKYDLVDYYKNNITGSCGKEIPKEYENCCNEKIYFTIFTKGICSPDKSKPIFSDEMVYNTIFTNPFNYVFNQDFKVTTRSPLIFPFLFPETQIILYPKKISYRPD